MTLDETGLVSILCIPDRQDGKNVYRMRGLGQKYDEFHNWFKTLKSVGFATSVEFFYPFFDFVLNDIEEEKELYRRYGSNIYGSPAS